MHRSPLHVNETSESSGMSYGNASFIMNESLPSIPAWVFYELIPVFSGVLCIAGLLGNGTIIFIILKCPKMRTVSNTYIFNLASADFLFFLGVPFLTYFNTARRWTFGNFMCKVVMGVDGMNMFTGILTLAAMAADRYFAIVHSSFSTKFRCVLVARIICAILWVIAVLVTLPLWIYATTENYRNVTVCSIVASAQIERMFIISSFITGFALPLTVITFSYSSIMHFLVKQNTKFRRRTLYFGRATSMILTTTVFFYACWIPFWVIRVVLFVSPSTHNLALQVVYYLTPVMSYLNSCVNPVIFTWFKDDFRKHMKCQLCNLSHRHGKRIRSESFELVDKRKNNCSLQAN
ncbi:somatostatin receptor type 5-like [Saccoglossus kowalevskii]